MKKDDYVQIFGVDGNYRYGYISSIQDRGDILNICLFDEGRSKIAFDAAVAEFLGEDQEDYVSDLTEVEKRIVPLLAAGLNTKEIAEHFNITPVTVRSQLRTLRIRLHLDDRAQLIAFSQALNGMIEKHNGNSRPAKT